MDPIATAKRLRDAMAEDDSDEASDAYEDLKEWQHSGGYMPDEATSAMEEFRNWSTTPPKGHWYTR